ncbi:MAG: hypothetical protein APF81_17410 [Desulfosporosinus sp. BRH_c37]|nr:MAG: hypothetical protein APF81_17410 [Desulfosporosinus sp. BRH_c37]
MVTKNEQLLKVMKGFAKDNILFDEWVLSRNIVKHLQEGPSWRQVTKKGLKGYMNSGKHDWGYPLYDHCDLWKDSNGKKVITSHAYAYFPGDLPNEHYYGYGTKEELELRTKESFDKLISWCDLRNLNVKFYSSNESWYKPGSTILIEVRENEGAKYIRNEAIL